MSGRVVGGQVGVVGYSQRYQPVDMVEVRGLDKERADGSRSVVGVGGVEYGLQTALDFSGVLDVGNGHRATAPVIIV